MLQHCRINKCCITELERVAPALTFLATVRLLILTLFISLLFLSISFRYIPEMTSLRKGKLKAKEKFDILKKENDYCGTPRNKRRRRK